MALALVVGAPLADAVAALTARPSGAAASAADAPSRRQRGALHARNAGDTSGPARASALRSRWPVRGPVNSNFGARRSAWGSRWHRGVDIGARPGTPVRAPLGGAVAFAGWRRGYGKTVIVDHGGGVRTLYGHLSRIGVRRGQRVVPGAPLGLTGATGNASGPHLHYETLVHGRAVDPRLPCAKHAAGRPCLR